MSQCMSVSLSEETLVECSSSLSLSSSVSSHSHSSSTHQQSLPCLPQLKRHFYLPVEIWILILLKSSNCSLRKCRLLNRKFYQMSNNILIKVYDPLVHQLNSTYNIACLSYNQLKLIKAPQLDHFKQFLLSPTTMENLSEIIWYTNPQAEVQSVCECLLRLFGAYPHTDSTTRPSWHEMRRILKRSDFKLWMLNLAVNIEFVDIKDTKKVEQIIRVDPLITYERLREVSMAAYRLLILVAASLQYSTISGELDISLDECKDVQQRFQSATMFLDCLVCRSDALTL